MQARALCHRLQWKRIWNSDQFYQRKEPSVPRRSDLASLSEFIAEPRRLRPEKGSAVPLAIQLLRPRAGLGLGVFPTTPDCHAVLGMAGRKAMGVEGQFELTGSCLPKLCRGKEHFTRPGPLAWKHLFPFKSARRLLPPQNA